MDSIGVNVHLAYADTGYRRLPAVRQRLGELGVAHVRDGLLPDNLPQADALLRLARAGVRSTLIAGEIDRPAGDSVSWAAERLLPALDAIEGPNELDNQGRGDWPDVLRRYTPALRRSAMRDRRVKRLPILGPSFVQSESRDLVSSQVADWDLSSYHPYPGGRPPESNAGEELQHVQAVDRGKPAVATETGYQNALRATTGQPPVSERAAGDYIPRLLLENFRLGVARTFIYELLDEKPDPDLRDPEQHFGLLRSDLTPKPAFRAVSRLIDVLRGGDSARAVGPVSPPAVEGVAAPGAVRHLLLQRADGWRVLALWRTEHVWDLGRRAEAGVRPTAARIRFAGVARTITVHRPSRDSAAMTRPDGDELTVPLEGDAVLIVFR